MIDELDQVGALPVPGRGGCFADLHEWRQLDIRRVFEGDDGDGDAAISKLYSEDEARLARGEKGDGGALLTQLLNRF